MLKIKFFETILPQFQAIYFSYF